MRGFLLCVWAVVTALMFYSALIYKAPSIEADVTARAAENIALAGGDDLTVEVDGRHVNLRGPVSSEDEKREYLEIARSTDGALGPTDGLVLPSTPARTFLTAARTPSGLKLSGVVGSEETRAALLAHAGGLNAGTIEDDLSVAFGEDAWSDKGTEGLSRLATLNSGQLHVSADSLSLSGDAPSADIADAIEALGGDWQTHVLRPEIEDPRIAALETELSAAEAGRTVDAERISALQDTIKTRDGEIAAITAEIANQADAITRQQEETALLSANLGSRESEISNLRAALETARQDLEAAGAEARSQNARISELEKQLAAEIETSRGRSDALSDMEERLNLFRNEGGEATSRLEEALSASTAEVAELEAGLVSLTEAKDGEIRDLEAQIAALKSDADARRSTLEAREASLSELEAQNSDLEARLSAETTRADALENQIAAQKQSITTLNQSMTERSRDADARLAALSDERDSVTAEKDALIADLAAEVKAREAAEAASRRLGGAIEDLEAKIADLQDITGRVPELEADLGARDSRITALEEELRRLPERSASTAASACSAAAQALLNTSKINFVSSSSELLPESIPVLERISGVVLACTGPDTALSVSVEGHTDSSGNADDNQQLSEARAASVAAFLEERGVPGSALGTVGLGASVPIADNATPEGRAENRRITFRFAPRS